MGWPHTPAPAPPPHLPPRTGCAPNMRVARMATEGPGEGKRKGEESHCHGIHHTDPSLSKSAWGVILDPPITLFGPLHPLAFKHERATSPRQHQHLSRSTSPHPAPSHPPATIPLG